MVQSIIRESISRLFFHYKNSLRHVNQFYLFPLLFLREGFLVCFCLVWFDFAGVGDDGGSLQKF